MLQSDASIPGNKLPLSIVADLAGFGARQKSNSVADLIGRDAVPAAIDITFSELGERMEEPVVEERPDPAGILAAAEAEAQARREAERERQVERSVAAAHDEGQQSARRACETEMVMKLAEERRKVDRLRIEFARDRQRFFAAAEAQVVKLALAVAERVLAREVASDGLHLRSAVKAALARVQESSATRLLVPVDEQADWQAMFERESVGKVTVAGDARMAAGECVVETTVGRVELGVAVQLEEIGRRFSEMLQVQEAPHTRVAETEEVGGY